LHRIPVEAIFHSQRLPSHNGYISSTISYSFIPTLPLLQIKRQTQSFSNSYFQLLLFLLFCSLYRRPLLFLSSPLKPHPHYPLTPPLRHDGRKRSLRTHQEDLQTYTYPLSPRLQFLQMVLHFPYSFLSSSRYERRLYNPMSGCAFYCAAKRQRRWRWPGSSCCGTKERWW